MEGFSSNGECILAYLSLFQALAAREPDGAACEEARALLARRELAAPEGVPLAPVLLRERLGLTERDFLLAMAALSLELDGGLRGDFRKRYGLTLPTVEYGLQLIESVCPSGVDALAALAGQSPLTGLLLVPSEEGGYSVERPLVLCRQALAFLTGLTLAEVRGVTIRRLEENAGLLPLHKDALAELRRWGLLGDAPLCLAAPEGAGRRTLLCRACGGAVCADLEAIAPLSTPERRRCLREAVLAARLLPAPVCAVHGGGRAEALRELEELCRTWSAPLAILAEPEDRLDRPRETIRLSPRLTAAERAAAWDFFLPNAAPGSCPQGTVTVGALRETAALALRYASAAGRRTVERGDAGKALRRRSGAVEFAVRYDLPAASLEEMVLPVAVRDQIERICQAAEQGGRLAAWGIPQSREGVTAVFHGPPGTGKTMAAGAIAGRLGLPLLRADLSQVMDKYVGETEKHLARLLQCAGENRCVLLFDEADALFSKRAEVTSGHDKYANLSTSFLLQEIERYEGVALLSTNLLSSFDEAFLRRLRYIVRFSLPDAPARETLWRRALPPERAAEDAPYELLAQAELSPARIHSAVRAAAVEAIAAGRDRVDGLGLVRAAGLELEKNGKPLPAALRDLLEKGAETESCRCRV